jgi:hypothetical protein
MRPDKDEILELCYEINNANPHSDEAKIARLLPEYIEAFDRLKQEVRDFSAYITIIEEAFKLAE